VRADLPFGVMAAQLIHAAGESSPGDLSSGTYAIALAAESEIQLLSIEKRLISKNIQHVAIREPDAPWGGQLMAIGIAPCDRSLIRKEVSQLPLIR
jgi:hypothetical protein